ncbi:MJ0042 family finger-like domain-containing protein [Desulfacinum hydrothermale DSM 13146]|uniref:MJ0042 family finger-like domain-containing protein n=1 Tax=Desulfacinum hydrothermale DSM 13146 TaxID=1121390 RepID=A0A1W1XEZ0_9BACT|nr:DUF3426 domain-containing protein [Desulfacinum hydrothermale]SMC22470.1 MJ0042 family finger-like domain-containing protein [Desulfacinum hydrothermale DSM 13146]
MIVSCELCGTKYRLDPSRLRKDRAKVRCSRCGHTFVVKKDAADESSAPAADALSPVPEPEQETISYQRPTPRPVRPQPAAKKKRSLAPVLLGLLVVAGLLAGGAYYYYAKFVTGPAPQEEAPTSPTAPPAVPQVTIEENIQAYFLENATVGQIFVVQGKVVNEESRPVSFVLLEGKLYTGENQPALVQKAFCGNVLSKEDLMQMDMADVQNAMMNREGKDLTNVHIPPQGKVPFMIVFYNLPDLEMLKDYSVEVVSAQVDQ